MKLVGLGESASALLAAFVTELLVIGIDVPEAVYVAPGQIPWDGPSLTISLGYVAIGQPGQPDSQSLISTSQIETTATLYLELIREVSTFGYGSGIVGLPTQEAMDVEGTQALDDAGAMVAAAIAVKASSQIVSLGAGFAIGQCLPIGPEGGLAAMRLELTLSIDGR